MDIQTYGRSSMLGDYMESHQTGYILSPYVSDFVRVIDFYEIFFSILLVL